MFDWKGRHGGDIGVVVGESSAKKVREVVGDKFLLNGLEGLGDVGDNTLDECPFMLEGLG